MTNREPPNTYEVKGQKISCVICGNNTFFHKKTLMTTPLLTFFGIEWLNAEAENYVCEDCGYVHWFLSEDDRKN